MTVYSYAIHAFSKSRTFPKLLAIFKFLEFSHGHNARGVINKLSINSRIVCGSLLKIFVYIYSRQILERFRPICLIMYMTGIYCWSKFPFRKFGSTNDLTRATPKIYVWLTALKSDEQSDRPILFQNIQKDVHAGDLYCFIAQKLGLEVYSVWLMTCWRESQNAYRLQLIVRCGYQPRARPTVFAIGRRKTIWEKMASFD